MLLRASTYTRMYFMQSQRKIAQLLQSQGAEKQTKLQTFRVRGEKSKLVYRHAELGAVKVRKNNNNNKTIFRPSHYSLYVLCSQERERKNKTNKTKKLTPFIYLFIATPTGHQYSEPPVHLLALTGHRHVKNFMHIVQETSFIQWGSQDNKTPI